MFSLVKNYRM